ncbi:MAG: hypothetical protein ABJF88_05135 [Rhodothermales bacterium]
MRIPRVAPAFLLVGVLAAALSLTGCDSDSNDEPTLADVAGAYETTLFTVEIEGRAVDVLAMGGGLDITLREDGTASGTLAIPEELNEEGEGDVRLLFGGTYALSGGEVTFDHEADTFVRDAVWTFHDGTLRAETDEISVILSKQ